MMLINKINPDKYLNSVKAYFNMLDSYKVFPHDEKFENDFIIKDIYTDGFLARPVYKKIETNINGEIEY